MRFSIGASQPRRATAIAFIIALGLFASLAVACNVPVYRYALDHWHPDLYRAVLFYSGRLSAEQRRAVDSLQADAANGLINLSIRSVDVASELSESDKELWAAAPESEVPRLVVQYPKHLAIDEPIWSRELKSDDSTDRFSALAILLDSPTRQEILRRLVSGQTAVWLLVDSGDATKDEVAAETIGRELKKLPQLLELPTLTDAPEDAIRGGPKLRIDFSLLRVSRDDDAEQALLAMLLNCESDLSTLDEPIVFPIFGRSRVLLPLVGDGISADNIRNSSAFLVGACSCQVKELNPGFDLLNTADWNKLIVWPLSSSPGDVAPGVASNAEPTLLKIPAGSASKTQGATEPLAQTPVQADTHADVQADARVSPPTAGQPTPETPEALRAATNAPSPASQRPPHVWAWNDLLASILGSKGSPWIIGGVVLAVAVFAAVFLRGQRVHADPPS